MTVCSVLLKFVYECSIHADCAELQLLKAMRIEKEPMKCLSNWDGTKLIRWDYARCSIKPPLCSSFHAGPCWSMWTCPQVPNRKINLPALSLNPQTTQTLKFISQRLANNPDPRFKMCSRSWQYQRFEYHQKLLSRKWSYGLSKSVFLCWAKSEWGKILGGHSGGKAGQIDLVDPYSCWLN